MSLQLRYRGLVGALPARKYGRWCSLLSGIPFRSSGVDDCVSTLPWASMNYTVPFIQEVDPALADRILPVRLAVRWGLLCRLKRNVVRIITVMASCSTSANSNIDYGQP